VTAASARDTHGTWITDARVAAPAAVDDAKVAEGVARAYLAAHVDRLAPGSTTADFTVLANQRDGDLRTVTFGQQARGLPVVGGTIGFVFGHDRLVAVRAAAVPNVVVDRVSVGRAIVRVDGADHVVDLRQDSDAITYIDRNGREIGRKPTTMFGAGTLAYNVPIRWPGSTRTAYPATGAAITVNGAGVTTASDGSFTWTGTAAASVVTSVSGPTVNVINSLGAAASTNLSVNPGGTGTWDASTDELVDAQLATFIYAGIAKTRARQILPSVTTWLDTGLDFTVNESGSCNAYATASAVHLARSNAQCENTGRIADVVFHEFAHSLHANGLIVGMGDFETNLSEGLADFYAANITGDPGVFRGMYRTDEPMRDLDPPGREAVYPADFDIIDPHISGLIIAGTLWDLRKDAGVAVAEKVFAGIVQRADDISTTFTAALIADDDDSDLTNGTPHYCAIETAFGRHGLVPNYAMTTVGAPLVTDRVITLRATTPTGTQCPRAGVDSIKVTWKVGDGVASEFSLVDTDGSLWSGEFPSQPEGTVITYVVDVTFSDGTISTYPNNPADPRYQMFVGPGRQIWCEKFDYDPGWQQSSNGGYEFQFGTPVTGPGLYDPDAAHTGPAVMGTGLGNPGRYSSNRVAGLYSPMLDVPAFETVHLQFWRWLTVEDSAYDQATVTANGTQVWKNASAPSGTLDHIDREWRFVDIDVTPWISDGTLLAKWTLTSDNSKELGGWNIDDVCLVGVAKIAACGDGEVDVGEQCDDGNRDSDDGCSASCIDELTAGGGGCCSASGGRDASAFLALLVLGMIGRRRRVQR
jgi:MYXO-CTERM domain-containing protein